MTDDEKRELRARDFWTALALMALSVFFLWKTSEIPFFNTANAGVRTAQWYNSAALVPFGIFGALFACALGLLGVAIRDGGAKHAIGLDRAELSRLFAIGLILLAYIAGLVPRVDFIIASGLVILALFWGFHRGDRRSRWIAVALCVFAAGYATIAHRPQAEWGAHDDDWVALAIWVLLVGVTLFDARHWNEGRRLGLIVSLLSALIPLVLICAMAFGFRQNVPARTGLIFSKIELSYYTQLRPWWRSLRQEEAE